MIPRVITSVRGKKNAKVHLGSHDVTKTPLLIEGLAEGLAVNRRVTLVDDSLQDAT